MKKLLTIIVLATALLVCSSCGVTVASGDPYYTGTAYVSIGSGVSVVYDSPYYGYIYYDPIYRSYYRHYYHVPRHIPAPRHHNIHHPESHHVKPIHHTPTNRVSNGNHHMNQAVPNRTSHNANRSSGTYSRPTRSSYNGGSRTVGGNGSHSNGRR